MYDHHYVVGILLLYFGCPTNLSNALSDRGLGTFRGCLCKFTVTIVSGFDFGSELCFFLPFMHHCMKLCQRAIYNLMASFALFFSVSTMCEKCGPRRLSLNISVIS